MKKAYVCLQLLNGLFLKFFYVGHICFFVLKISMNHWHYALKVLKKFKDHLVACLVQASEEVCKVWGMVINRGGIKFK